MKQITFQDLKPGELAFLADSGRAYRVQVSEVSEFNSPLARELGLPENGPEYLGDHYLLFQAVQADPTTGAYLSAMSPVEGRHINGSLISSGQDSHRTHWYLHRDMAKPAVNPSTPAGLAAGSPVQDTTGATWYMGSGKPDPATGAPGDYYVDSQNGHRWKKRAGLMVFHAQNIAAELDENLSAVSDRATFNLPKV